MIQAIIGKKIDQTSIFLTDGRRLSATKIDTSGNVVVQAKTIAKDGYTSVQLGFAMKKSPSKAMLGVSKKAGLTNTPAFFHEVKLTEGVSEDTMPKAGEVIAIDTVMKIGDVVKVTGTSKGKGFAGGVKRHGFRGGPRTHGQSDRERAPGSIGQTTTPGRVYKGKRMAGRMGHATVSVTNLVVLDIIGSTVLVKGLVPGSKNSIVIIEKTGESKKFVPVIKTNEKKEEEKPQQEGLERTQETKKPDELVAVIKTEEAQVKEQTPVKEISEIKEGETNA